MILYCCCAGAPSSPAAAELVGRLRLLAVLVRYMETSSNVPTAAGSVHPAMRLLQIAYPALEAVAGSAALQADEKVYKALCEVRACTHFLCNAGIINPVAAPLSCLHRHQEDTLDVCMHHDIVQPALRRFSNASCGRIRPWRRPCCRACSLQSRQQWRATITRLAWTHWASRWRSMGALLSMQA